MEEAAAGSECPLGVTEEAAPGRDRPAETGLSGGSEVRRFGGVSRGKSGGTTGWGRGRRRGLGELGRDEAAAARPFDDTARLPADSDGLDAGEREGTELRRVGVDGREAVRGVRFAGICGLELGVEGLELC